MEGLAVNADSDFWRGRRVFLTGHTGFKGGWLALWLHRLGASVHGYSLAPPTVPSLFEVAKIQKVMASSTIGDIRDATALRQAMVAVNPEFVMHMAAQSLVRQGYAAPLETLATNVMGTAHTLEAVRSCAGVRAVIVVSSDKCYDDRKLSRAYVEDDALGGRDPYSASKACTELIALSYMRSFFEPAVSNAGGVVALATVRAGNVVGGGDWSADRLVPDFFRAVAAAKPLLLRHPAAVRPWQHVLEPLGGYIKLGERLMQQGQAYAGAWNFGPDPNDALPVSAVADRLIALWGEGARQQASTATYPHEAQELRLDWSKASCQLKWRPRWRLDEALRRTVAWAKAAAAGTDMLAFSQKHVEDYVAVQTAS